MAYRYGERQQHVLFPSSIEDYISAEDPVRVYDAFVNALDWNDLDIDYIPNKLAPPPFDPKAMLKVLIFGYSYGVRSSRKLERALHHNLAFIWLAGGLKPDHKTLSEFRRNNKKGLKKVLKQCARLCVKLNVIEGNTLFVDGSKIRANAGRNKTRTQKGCEKALSRIDQRIDAILKECEQVDQAEQTQGSLVKLQGELADQHQLKEKIQSTLAALKTEGLERTNTTDPDCELVHGRQGSHAGYNGQIVVDEQHGLIVSSDVVNDHNDLQQFSNQIEQAHKTLGSPCKNAVADAGYSNADELEKVDTQGIKVVVPNNQQASGKSPPCFDKRHFVYDPEQDCYLCPEGKRIAYWRYDGNKKARQYTAGGDVCMDCQHFGKCTKSKKHGRMILLYDNQAVRDKLYKQYEQPASQKIFSRRKETVELPFGHIKRNLGVGSFLLRGLNGVRGEMSVLCSCFNIARLIGTYGVSGLLSKLGKI